MSLTPNTNDVDIRCLPLDLSGSVVNRLRQLLGPDEITRAERFHFEKDRRHFIVARGGLRILLATYLRIDPAEVQFRYNKYGKPSLAGATNELGLSFNLAHSGVLAVYGFAFKREIGIDLEFIRADFGTEEIAQRYFSPSEVAELMRVPLALRNRAFFNCWARKEAFIKALGMGLSLGLDQFDVSLEPDKPAALLRTGWDPMEALRWSLTSLDIAPEYAAAVAVEGQDFAFHIEHLNECALI